MTFHSRSIIAFGQFFNAVSDSVLGGAPVGTSLDLIRTHFAANIVVLAIESRSKASEANYISAPAFNLLDEGSKRRDGGSSHDISGSMHARGFTALFESCHHVSASHLSADESTCYTLTIFRSRSDSPFDQEEQSVCELLVSHLTRGLQMAWRMGATEVERTLYSDVADRLDVGVVILDRTGRILRTSSIADRILTQRDSLFVHGGRLRATCPGEDRELQAAIKAALRNASEENSPCSRGLSLTKQNGLKSLGLIIRPIEENGHEAAANASIAIYLRDPEMIPEIESDLVRQLFDLTPAEAAVVRRLSVGLSLDEAAHALDISRNTARAHLRSIFSKSGITRQTELVRLVLNSAALLGERRRQAA